MRAVRSLIWRLGNRVRPSRTEREMGDERTFHIQSRAEDLVRTGLSSTAAERQARLAFCCRVSSFFACTMMTGAAAAPRESPVGEIGPASELPLAANTNKPVANTMK